MGLWYKALSGFGEAFPCRLVAMRTRSLRSAASANDSVWNRKIDCSRMRAQAETATPAPMLAMIASPKALHLRSLAPSIRRSKS